MKKTVSNRIGRSLWVVVVMCFCSIAGAVESDPRSMVLETYEQVRILLEKEDGSNTSVVQGEVEQLIFPRFDFSRMTALAVGKHWRQAQPPQKEALSSEFRSLLARTYFITMLRYRDSKVHVKPDVQLENQGKEATIRTEVAIPGTQTPVLIDYVLYKTPEGWKVFNVVVEGASLVTVYRNQFAEEVNKGGLDGLIQSLHNKNQATAHKPG